jgi:hypothetical protein
VHSESCVFGQHDHPTCQAAKTFWLPGYLPHVALPFRNVGEKKEEEQRDT